MQVKQRTATNPYKDFEPGVLEGRGAVMQSIYHSTRRSFILRNVQSIRLGASPPRWVLIGRCSHFSNMRYSGVPQR